MNEDIKTVCAELWKAVHGGTVSWAGSWPNGVIKVEDGALCAMPIPRYHEDARALMDIIPVILAKTRCRLEIGSYQDGTSWASLCVGPDRWRRVISYAKSSSLLEAVAIALYGGLYRANAEAIQPSITDSAYQKIFKGGSDEGQDRS